MNFTFDTVPQIIFETGAVARLGEIIATRMKRPFVVTDKGVIKAGLIDSALESLKASGLDYHLFDGVKADPPAKVVKHAIDAA
ncbi:MAG: iron-containing alcohol dehydrogenase, partial [Alphaproteobacteria bacterium]|nr:iron-containing alcohol dehydrogenase [Alphaproteobacteria bacterium]